VAENKERLQQINRSLETWQQGDCVVGEHWFVYRFNSQHPLTDEAKTVVEDDADGDIDLVESEVMGFMVVTQTCDIVRSCVDRPFLEVVPLIQVDRDKLDEIQRCQRPQYVFIPGLSKQSFVADLDRVMTVEKALVVGWQRVAGCSNDEEIRLLQQALARKRNRFAFPDDFAKLSGKLRDRLKGKHDKSSSEGEALRALQEIRVTAVPSWNSEEVEIMFFFIRNTNESKFQLKEWSEWLENWLRLVHSSGRFCKVDGIVTTIEDLTAKEYLGSQQLDLDNLSHVKVGIDPG
jgi:hypothetical protein